MSDDACVYAARRMPFPVDEQKLVRVMRQQEGRQTEFALAVMVIELFAQWAENQARIAYVCVDCIGKGSVLTTGEAPCCEMCDTGAARCCETCDGSGRVYR